MSKYIRECDGAVFEEEEVWDNIGEYVEDDEIEAVILGCDLDIYGSILMKPRELNFGTEQ